MIYRIIFFIFMSGIFCFYDYLKKTKNRYSKYFFVLIVVLLSLIFAMREFIMTEIGTDYYAYREWYENVSVETLARDTIDNYGFNLLIFVIKSMFDNFYVFLFICGIIINVCIFKFIEKNCKSVFLPAMIYIALFYANTFNVTRQWIACSIFLYAFNFIKEKKMIEYFAFCIIAALFHSSAIFLILLYPLLRKNDKVIKKQLIILGIGLLAILHYAHILRFLLSGKFVVLDTYSKYSDYSQGVANYVYPTICGLTLFVLNFYFKNLKHNKENGIKIIYLSLALILSILSMKSFIFYRYCIYFLPSLILALPIILELFKKSNRLFIKIVICIFLCGVFI